LRQEKATRVTIEALSGELLGLEEADDTYMNECFDPEDVITFRVFLNDLKLHRMTPSTVRRPCFTLIAGKGPAY
jgi:hypothetical protein